MLVAVVPFGKLRGEANHENWLFDRVAWEAEGPGRWGGQKIIEQYKLHRQRLDCIYFVDNIKSVLLFFCL